MPRKPRIEFEGAFYHVITRGNQQQDTFRKPDDYLEYLSILSSYKKRYGFFLYAYALMRNHVHLLIEIRTTPLSKIMQGINQRYTMHFNKEYGTVGHLFQGRYKAILCDQDEYLLTLVRYIHLNPVRAKVVLSPEEYRWSSHRGYAQRGSEDPLVDTDQVLRLFSDDKGAARRHYRAYMEEANAIGKEDVYRTVDQRILGDEQFVESVKQESTCDVDHSRRVRGYPLEAIAEAIEVVQGSSLEDLRSRSKSAEISTGKALFSFVAHEYGYRGKEIAAFIGKDPSIITRFLKKRGLSGEVEKVVAALKKRKSQ